MATVKLKISDIDLSFDHEEYGKLPYDQQQYALDCLCEETYEVDVEDPEDDDEVYEVFKDHLSYLTGYDVYRLSYVYLN